MRAAALVPLVREGGSVAIGEPFWRQWPLPDGIEQDDFLDHPDADDIRVQHDRYRSDYFRFKRALLGWAIFVGRKV
jgi:hypothetical protein